MLRYGGYRVAASRGLAQRRWNGNVVSYYDSQSGQHVSYTDSIHIHGHFNQEPSVSGNAINGIRGLDSVTLAEVSWNSPAIRNALVETKNVYLPAKSNSPNYPLAVEILCTSPRESWDSVLALCSAATKAGHPVKSTLRNAFASSDVKIQLAGSLLADVGASIITLDDEDNLADEDNFLEAVEALTWCDVVGLPMNQRVGYRVSTESVEDLLDQAISELGIKNFDVGCSISATSLLTVLTSTGNMHKLSIEE